MILYNTQGQLIEGFTEYVDECKDTGCRELLCSSKAQYFSGETSTYQGKPTVGCVTMSDLPFHGTGAANTLMSMENTNMEECKRMCAQLKDCKGITLSNTTCMMKSKVNLNYANELKSSIKFSS